MQQILLSVQQAIARRPKVYVSLKPNGNYDFAVQLIEGSPDRLGKTLYSSKGTLVDISTVCNWTITREGVVEFKIEGTTFQSAADFRDGYTENVSRLTYLLRMDLMPAARVIAFCNDSDAMELFNVFCDEWNEKAA